VLEDVGVAVEADRRRLEQVHQRPVVLVAEAESRRYEGGHTAGMPSYNHSFAGNVPSQHSGGFPPDLVEPVDLLVESGHRHRPAEQVLVEPLGVCQLRCVLRVGADWHERHSAVRHDPPVRAVCQYGQSCPQWIEAVG
jgi:hypothetical protein